MKAILLLCLCAFSAHSMSGSSKVTREDIISGIEVLEEAHFQMKISKWSTLAFGSLCTIIMACQEKWDAVVMLSILTSIPWAIRARSLWLGPNRRSDFIKTMREKFSLQETTSTV